MDRKIRTVLTVRLFTDEKCFGPGVATLLHKVRELHSLRKLHALREENLHRRPGRNGRFLFSALCLLPSDFFVCHCAPPPLCSHSTFSRRYTARAYLLGWGLFRYSEYASAINSITFSSAYTDRVEPASPFCFIS